MNICVIMSTYNGEKYIEQQLDSIFQNKKKYEIVLYVRDDDSTDKTVEILKRYGTEHQVQIEMNEGQNVGSAESFLVALRDCPKAEYYAFCDQDDVWLDGKLSAAVEQIGITTQPILWCSDYQVTDSDLQVITSSALKQPVQDNIRAVFYNNVPGCTMVFNWALMQELRKVNISKIRMHDIMAINVALITGQVIFDKMPYVLYRQHENNVLGYNHKRVQIRKWIKDKLELIKNKEDYSTAEYAQAILNAFESKMNEKQKEEYKLISEMNGNLVNRMKVLMRPYTKAKFGRTSISIRCKILLNLM